MLLCASKKKNLFDLLVDMLSFRTRIRSKLLYQQRASPQLRIIRNYLELRFPKTYNNNESCHRPGQLSPTCLAFTASRYLIIINCRLSTTMVINEKSRSVILLVFSRKIGIERRQFSSTRKIISAVLIIVRFVLL